MPEKILQAPFSGVLKIGDVEIPAFVLEDGTRVISARGMTKAIGMKGRGQGITRVLTHQTLNPYLNDELKVAINEPIHFKTKSGMIGTGYEATILQKLCDAILEARDKGVLKTDQEIRYGEYAFALIRAFAKVGIIALVDEATNYQEVRDRFALQKILDAYLLPYAAAWAKRFPDSFYKSMFRLKGWNYDPTTVKRPSIIGTMTNDIVYERLAPGILEQLKERTPKDERGRRKHRYHQLLTEDIGHPKLQEHLLKAQVLMDASPNYPSFHRMLQRALPRLNETVPMDIPED